MDGGGRLYFAAAQGRWLLETSCDECTGYVLDLRLTDPAEHAIARARADAYLRKVHEVACAGCDSRERLRAGPAAGSVDVWWDASSGEWLGSAALPDAVVCLPLGVRTYWARREAEASAALLLEAGVPLRVAADRGECMPDAHTAFYDAAAGRWMLRVGCPECGGCDLPLTATGRGAIERACEQARSCVERIERTECPHCRSLRERELERDPDGPPALWYDTFIREWVAWAPLPGGGATLPVGLTRYDVNERQLLLAAAGVQL